MSTSNKSAFTPTPAQSLIAGIVAGAVEGAVTYPAEFVKTKVQFHSGGSHQSTGVVSILTNTIRERGISGLYSGAGALIIGNGAKAGVRFLTYDGIKGFLKDDQGKITPFRSMLAGLGAGVCEAVVAVTPSETLKTKLIDDAALAVPRYSNMAQGVVGICRVEGFGGIYRGLGPTVMKQAANSAVRFSSFTVIQDALTGVIKPESGKLGSTGTFAAGAGAGLITVYATMPLDNIKTRMQAIDGHARYRNSLDCFRSIIREEGAKRLWGGTTPRLARLMLSGGIVFTVYDSIMSIMK